MLSREEHTQDTFQRLAALYAEIRSHEESSQPTYIIDNNDTTTSAAQLSRIAEVFITNVEKATS